MSDLLARLIEAGTPAELISEVAMLLAEKRVAETAIEARRRNDRDRTARKRSQDVTGCHVTERDVTDDAPLSRPPNEINSNPPTHTPPDMTTRARKADPFPKPEWADAQVWADWMDVRKAKGGRNTVTAYAGFLAAIERETNDEWPPGRLLAHAVTESWKSIHRPQERNYGNPRNVSLLPTSNSRGTRPDPCLDMLRFSQTPDDPEGYFGDDQPAWPPLPAIGSG